MLLELKELHSRFQSSEKVRHLCQILQEDSEQKNIHMEGVSGSSLSFLVASVFNQTEDSQFVVLPDKECAAYFLNDLEKLLPKNKVFFLPSSYKKVGRFDQQENSQIVLRTEVISHLARKKSKVTVVSYPEALSEKVISAKELESKTLEIKVGNSLSIAFVEEVLREYNFMLVDFVYEPGQYSIRGSIVDIFSYAYDQPYRIDFFGDDVESIRSFDLETQLSCATLDEIVIIPNIQDGNSENRLSLMEQINKKTTFWIDDVAYVEGVIDQFFEKADFSDENTVTDTSDMFIRGSSFTSALSERRVVEFGVKKLFKADHHIPFAIHPQPVFNKNFEMLSKNLADYQAEGYELFFLSDHELQLDRLASIFKQMKQTMSEINIETHTQLCLNVYPIESMVAKFKQMKEQVDFTPVTPTIHEGFVDDEQRICCYTDHQVFERYHRFHLKNEKVKSLSVNLQELNDLQPGDYVVHIDHGIGKFAGLEKIDVNGKVQEAIKLVYRDNDVLFVNIHALHRISKYKGKDAEPPKIYKLGTGAWKKLKKNTRKRLKDIARDLIALYAKRKEATGFSFSSDSYMQKELEASFIFEDTPDQSVATEAVKEGMENSVPMDRLLCGDVGFGKTEVAIRAAFKSAVDNKQVAVLVPTTVLAFQHYNTFKERLKDFPCRVDYISRMRTSAAQKKTLQELEKGNIDIIIGTHRLVGKDVKFKDLGLLIIDEEQKFGVSTKEKIKQLRAHIDTLTLTATPIPRTLQFSLMGARDLSVINTPPPNRHPIITEIHGFNEKTIKSAIEYEVSRNGQVFFVHNRVQNIKDIEVMLRRICPGVSTVVAHGQMRGEELERVMLDFMQGKYDVLVATTIIESGLDIPNANTIIINQAQNYGLSDLHQLRGRVGRSNKKAFCYLLAPPLHVLPADARRRLKAIEAFSALGSGFNIAMQDLDIRGAGNILGAEQSGYITEIGYETYQRILDEAIHELREKEFKKLFYDEEKVADQLKTKNYVLDCQVDTDMELLIPESYVQNIAERIRLYKRIDNLQTEGELEIFEEELTDRFGTIPDQVRRLMLIVRLRWKAVQLGFEKLIMKNGKLIAFFVTNQESPYYQSNIFSGILDYVQHHKKGIKLKERNHKLSLVVEAVNDVEKCLALMKHLQEYVCIEENEKLAV